MTQSSLTPDSASLEFEPLEYDARYYIQTAKNNIESLTQVIAEAVSNSDEAIRRRAEQFNGEDSGRIRIHYDPETMLLTVVDDGIGMSSDEMRSRLRHVGLSADPGSKRGFFHRGIREVFTAMGGGEVISIPATTGPSKMSHAIFDPSRGMAFAEKDRLASAQDRPSTGLDEFGTMVRIPMRRFAQQKPKLYSYAYLEAQIMNCVQLRPVLLDNSREIVLQYGGEPPKVIRYEYESGEVLVAPVEILVAGHKATFWANATDRPIKSSLGKQLRRHGILIRGERAAYEVSLGLKLKTNPSMQLIYGELRLDEIENLQREADAKADDEAQLIYRADRTGLNDTHPLVEDIHTFIDAKLMPLVSQLEGRESKRTVSADVRRQLQKLAQVINQVIREEDFGGLEHSVGTVSRNVQPIPRPQTPPTPPTEQTPRVLDHPIEFAYDRIFLNAGQSRTIEMWVDADRIAVGSRIEVLSPTDEILRHVTLSRIEVPEPEWDGVATVRVTLLAGQSEGRHEFKVGAGGQEASLPIHVRFPRASGFISQIVLDDKDWETGSALYDPASGRVTVFTGRPEFRDAANRAKREKAAEPLKHPLFRQLVVESVREAALRPAAERRAEVEWDDLPADERRDREAFHRLALIEYFDLDYKLRSRLLKVFLDGS